MTPATKTLILYVVVGVAYIACGLLFLGLLYSSALAILFLFVGVWILPRLWARLRGRAS